MPDPVPDCRLLELDALLRRAATRPISSALETQRMPANTSAQSAVTEAAIRMRGTILRRQSRKLAAPRPLQACRSAGYCLVAQRSDRGVGYWRRKPLGETAIPRR